MNKKQMLKISNGITLIALVITIIILIILAGVSINLTIGQDGIITRAREAKENIQIAVNEENEKLAELLETLNKDYEIAKKNKANEPVLLTGMIPVKFTMPTEESKGSTVETTKTDSNWYEYGTTYETKRWANAITKDDNGQISGYFVWIPRFAYKINNTNQTVDVVFLIEKTDNYYDEEGKMQTAQRQTEIDQYIETDSSKTDKYTVHPAFTDESSINFANGGWDSELTGIWVAKFEAGYASGNNNAIVKASNVNYSNYNNEVAVPSVERPRNEDNTGKGDGAEPARNWLDGIYGSTVTAIKYPVFQGTTYSMNYINHNDSYNIAKALTDNGNIYGFSKENADSHLMKNSEWGAVSYLSASIYGQYDKEITVNNVSLNSGGSARTESSGKSGVDSVYVVTGCTSNETERGEIITTIEKINEVSGNTPTIDTYGIYTWNQKTGQNASTTGTIYGIYDMSGGMIERVSSYVPNGHHRLKRYGESVTYDADILRIESTKYTMIYPNDQIYDNKDVPYSQENLDKASQANFENNTKIYGDAIRETTSSIAGTSKSGWTSSSWNIDYSIFPGNASPFLYRGGKWNNAKYSGVFAFFRHFGGSNHSDGFRAVVVPVN